MHASYMGHTSLKCITHLREVQHQVARLQKPLEVASSICIHLPIQICILQDGQNCHFDCYLTAGCLTVGSLPYLYRSPTAGKDDARMWLRIVTGQQEKGCSADAVVKKYLRTDTFPQDSLSPVWGQHGPFLGATHFCHLKHCLLWWYDNGRNK